MAIRKENSVATRRSKPKSSAPIMVEPERENAWNQRKTLCKADFKRIADGDFTQRANPRRAARIAAPALYPQNHDASRNQPQCRRRRARERDIERAAICLWPARERSADNRADSGAQRPAQCGNRADLNHDIKGFGLLTGKIQRAAQNN